MKDEGAMAEVVKQTRKFRGGHRRAFSMPNASGDRMLMAVVDNDSLMVMVSLF